MMMKHQQTINYLGIILSVLNFVTCFLLWKGTPFLPNCVSWFLLLLLFILAIWFIVWYVGQRLRWTPEDLKDSNLCKVGLIFGDLIIGWNFLEIALGILFFYQSFLNIDLIKFLETTTFLEVSFSSTCYF